MNYHVFIVDMKTFKYHLEYLFAGTGAANRCISFLKHTEISMNWAVERMLVGMIADISRIRKDDKIIFYLQSNNGLPGMFFGVFKAASTAFFDENDSNNYLSSDMKKGLSFRIEILPDRVYPLGITEHEALDSLNERTYSYEMCWSLIYRKLKGNRGCTMITDYEYNDLVRRIDKKNRGQFLNGSAFTFFPQKMCIISWQRPGKYSGRMESIDIYPRMLFKASKNNSFETHLQAFIIQNIDDPKLNSLIMPLPSQDYWLGNEVSCGVGMQRIDLMIKQEDRENIYIKCIELKDEEPVTAEIINQIGWYIRWIYDYMVPNYKITNKAIHIMPMVIAKRSEDFITFLGMNNKDVGVPDLIYHKYEYIAFDIKKDFYTDQYNIIFDKIV